jgi:hypothetical protein
MKEDPGWWERMVGEPPERSQLKPKLATRTDWGPFANGVLTCEQQPTRFDWVIRPVEEPANWEIQNLGVWPDAASDFAELALKWLASPECPPVWRLAWGGRLVWEVEDPRAGLLELQHFLSAWVKMDPDSGDFLYRINRRRISHAGVAGLQVNRLSTWTVARTDVIPVPPEAGGSRTRFDRVLEFDINTAPDQRTPFPPTVLGAVFSELREMALEISTQGDVK